MRNLTKGLPRRGLIATALLALAGMACAGSSLAVPQGTASAPANAKKTGPPAAAKPIDINSASRSQLKKLPGIGDAEAARIIAARPYRSKAELVTKQVLPEGVYLSLRRRIMAGQKGAS